MSTIIPAITDTVVFRGGHYCPDPGDLVEYHGTLTELHGVCVIDGIRENGMLHLRTLFGGDHFICRPSSVSDAALVVIAS